MGAKLVIKTLVPEYEKKCKKFLLTIEEFMSQKWPVKLSKIHINSGANAYYGAIPLYIHLKVHPSFEDSSKVNVKVNLTMGTEENYPFQSEWLFEKKDFDWSEGKEVADLIFQSLSKKIPRFISVKLI